MHIIAIVAIINGFQRDFDSIDKKSITKNIFNLITPKACARCKSKYWNKPRIRNRKLPTSIPIDLDDGMITVPRMRALKRNTARTKANKQEMIKQSLRLHGYNEEMIARILSEVKAEAMAKDKDEEDKIGIPFPIAIPIPVPNRKKKKSRNY